MKVAKRRIQIHINLSPKTVKKFDMISQQFGMAPHILASRLLRWFDQQDAEIREKILTRARWRGNRESLLKSCCIGLSNNKPRSLRNCNSANPAISIEIPRIVERNG